MKQLNYSYLPIIVLTFLLSSICFADEKSTIKTLPDELKNAGPAQFIDTPYTEDQNVLFEFFLDDPDKIHSALFS